ncbi:TetR/AcrR family transcriptional regulator, partial [Streptomyces sp. SID11233]|nr:TetR/AcrR family transcriptional regulator [Streptomyces sp. SID11233]
MMHAAGDWWLAERPCAREELVEDLTELLWGMLGRVPDRDEDSPRF